MKLTRPIFSLVLLFTFTVAMTACKKAATRTVSFTLSQADPAKGSQPFANEELAVFPVDDGKITTGDANRLGLGKTDASGHATIEFNPSQYKDFVLLWRTRNVYMMLRTHDGKALTFKCDNPTCDLGNVPFELFEFSFKSAS